SSHNLGEFQKGWVCWLVLFDDGVKADALFAVLFVVGEFYPLRIIGYCSSVFDDLWNRLGRDEQEFWVLVNELLDQPGTSDPVNFCLLTCNPFHIFHYWTDSLLLQHLTYKADSRSHCNHRFV